MLADVSADDVQVLSWDSALLGLLTYVAYLLLLVRFADQRRVAYAHRHGQQYRRTNGDRSDRESAG